MDEFARLRIGAVILTGGTARRLGGVDKAQLVVGGRTLLASALEAVREVGQIVIVGPVVDLTPYEGASGLAISFVTEDPPSGGPAAGLLAGRDALSLETDLLVVLAVDMPGVTADTVRRLVDARADADGVFLHDPSGRRQLAGVLNVRRLDAVRPRPDQVSGLPIHRLLASLHLTELAGKAEESRDVDTPADLQADDC